MTQKIERRKSSCNCIIKPSFFHKFASMLFARLCKTFCLKEITQKVYLASAATFILFATFLVLLWLLKEFGDATHSRLFANSTSLLGYFCWIVPWWVIFSSTLPRPTISWCYQCQLPAKEIISPLSLCQSLSTTVAAKMGLFSCSPLLGKRTWHCHFPIHSEIWP